MAKRLLQRQSELLEYLTSSAAIFGENEHGARAPAGFDPWLLRLEASFSHEKRLEKIRAVFARTFTILGPASDQLVRQFVDACPPSSIRRLDNARQFHAFTAARWRLEPPQPGYLPDVAACELALAEARAAADTDMPRAISPAQAVRRPASVKLLRCAWDVRPIFEAAAEIAPAARDTPLAFFVPPGRQDPRVFELSPAVFELLSTLDAAMDPAVFGAPSAVFAELEGLGLVERVG